MTQGLQRREPRAQRSREAGRPASPEELGRLLALRGFHLSQKQLAQLAVFHRLLVEKNRRLNLTRIWNLEEMVVKHYVDCFIVLKLLKDLPSPLLDIGTGPGFPGIPLKILRPDLHVLLGEGVRKRVEFLREVRDALGFARLDLIGRNIDREFVYPVSGVITRAVEPIGDTLKRVGGCLRTEGQAIFMKGPGVEEEVRFAAGKFAGKYELVEDMSYTLPGTEYRRRLVVYRRLARGETRTDGEAAAD